MKGQIQAEAGCNGSRMHNIITIQEIKLWNPTRITLVLVLLLYMQYWSHGWALPVFKHNFGSRSVIVHSKYRRICSREKYAFLYWEVYQAIRFTNYWTIGKYVLSFQMQEHFFFINKIVKGISTNIRIVLFLLLRGPLIFSHDNNFHHLHFFPLVSHVFICLCQLLAFFGLTLFRAVSTQMGVNSNDIIRQIFCQLSPTNNDRIQSKMDC